MSAGGARSARLSAAGAIQLRWGLRIVDAASGVLFAVFFAGVLFASNPSFDEFAMVVAAASIVGAIAAGDLRGTPVAWPLGVYAFLAVVSAVVHRHDAAAIMVGSPATFSARHPAIHILVLVAYFYAAVWVLRTPRRVAALAVFFVSVVSVFGVLTSLDHVAVGFQTRIRGYDSVPQWNGYPELSTLANLALPFLLAVVMLSRSRRAIVASLLLAGVLVLTTFGLQSRSADATLVLTYLWLAVIEAARLKRYRLLLAAAPLACLAVVFWLKNPLRLAFDVPSAPDALGFRYAVWRNAIDMIRDHPWLGVGAGNYTAALRADYRSPGVFLDAHAHNTMLHVAVESGIPALIAFLVVWYRVFRFGYERGLGGNLSAIVMVGSIGALAAFAVRSVGEHFLSGLPSSDRMSFLVWTFLAAATALYQWNQTDARAART